MSYLEIIKKSLNKSEEKKEEECKPGWIVLSKKNYLEKMRKKNEEKNKNEEKEIEQQIEVKNEELLDIEEDYEQEFSIKYGCDIIDFYIDMEDEFRERCYNILDKHKFGSCYSYDLQNFVMKHTDMKIKDANENTSFDSEEESFNRDDFY
jgi:O6-methylguanine-DNA--protein-cysteine methyltransferase